MSERRLRGFALAFLAAGCGRLCDPAPPSIPSGCWEHSGASVDDLSCAAAVEHEPNGDLVAANRLPDGTCELQFFEGSVSDDVDAFRVDGPRCQPDSQVQATLDTSEDDLRLCLFAACRHGKTGLSGCSGDSNPAGQTAVEAHMPEGVQGCCRAGQGKLSVNVNCDSEYAPFGKEAAWLAYLVVDRVRDSACSTYKVGYKF